MKMNIFRMIKYTLAVSAAAFTAAAVSSCAKSDSFNSNVHINEAMRYMRNKYGVEFTYDEDSTKAITDGASDNKDEYVDVLLTCEKLPDLEIRVCSSDGDKFFDDLVPKKFEHQALSDIQLAAKTVYTGDKPKVMLLLNEKNEMADRTLPADTSYEDFLLSGALGLVEVYTDDSDAPLEDYRRLSNMLASNDINCKPSVYYFTDNSYEDITKDAPAKAYDGNDKKLGHISIKNDECILNEEFDGDIMIDDLYALDTDAVYLKIFPADNEDTAAYDAMFVPHDGTTVTESKAE
jgi:hypothetical protein